MNLPYPMVRGRFTPFLTPKQGTFHYTNPCSVISLPNTCPVFSQGRIQILVLPLVGSIKEMARFVWPLQDDFSVTADGFTHCSQYSVKWV